MRNTAKIGSDGKIMDKLHDYLAAVIIPTSLLILCLAGDTGGVWMWGSGVIFIVTVIVVWILERREQVHEVCNRNQI